MKHVFRFTKVHTDGEFAPVQESITEILSGPIVNLTSANKHVPKINHLIRMVKESFSATRHSLPFIRLPVT